MDATRIMRNRLLWALILILIGLLLAPGNIRLKATSYGAYDDLLLSTFSGHVVALWPLNETAGVIAYDISGNSRNGTYSGVTLNQIDGAGTTLGRAGLWDGINDSVNVFSSGLASAFSGTKGTLAAWVYNKTNVLARIVFWYATNSSNRIILQRNDSTNDWGYRIAGGTPVHVASAGIDNSWYHYAITWDESISPTGEVKVFMNGSQVGTTQTGIGIWNQVLTAADIGYDSINNNFFWYGYIQQVIELDYAASGADISIIADPNPPIATATPTATATTLTSTPRPPQLIATLSNGNQFEIDYSITAGDIALSLLGLVVLGLLVFWILLKLVRR